MPEYEIKDSTGKVVASGFAPEGMSQAEIMERAQKAGLGARATPMITESQKNDNANTGGFLEDLARNAGDVLGGLGTGVTKGLIGATVALPGNLGEAAHGIGTMMGANPDRPYMRPKFSDLNSRLPDAPMLPTTEEVMKLLPQMHEPPPKSAGAAVQNIAEGAASMPFGGPVAAAIGGISGAGGEIADRLFNSPWARMVGQVLGLAPGAALLRPTQTVKAARDVAEEAAANKAALAASKAQNDAALGVNTNLAHGAADNSPLVAMAAEIKASPQGKNLRQLEAAEAEALKVKQAETITNTRGGDVNQDAANNVLKSVTQKMQDTKQAIGDATGPLFTEAAKEKIPSIANIILNLQTAAKQANLAGPFLSPIEKVIKDLQTVIKKDGSINPVELDRFARAAGRKAEGAKNPAATPEMTDAAPANAIIHSVIGDATKVVSPDIFAAKFLHRGATENLVDTVKQGAVGRSFPDNMLKTGQGKYDTMGRVFREPGDFGPGDVVNVAEATGKTFPNLFKQHIESKSDLEPGAWAKAIAGDMKTPLGQKQRLNFEEGVKQTALVNGVAEEEATAAAKGAGNLMDATQSVEAGNKRMFRPADMTEFGEKAGQSGMSTVLRVVVPWHKEFVRTWSMANALDKAIKQRTYSQVADMLTSPEGIDRLIGLSKWNAASNATALGFQGIQSLISQNPGDSPPVVSPER